VKYFNKLFLFLIILFFGVRRMVVINLVVLAMSISLLAGYLTSRKRYKSQLQHSESRLKVAESEVQTYKDRLEYTKNQVSVHKEQLKKSIPLGEQLILDHFKENFDQLFRQDKDTVIFHQLEINSGSKKIDFFIVSSQGLFVIESKCWKGVTYVYDGKSVANEKEVIDIFKGTPYCNFGCSETAEENDKKYKVFNVRENDKKGEMILSAYNENPIVQSKNYSRALAGILRTNKVRNLVVFTFNNDCSVIYNNEPLESRRYKKVDDYTTVVYDSNLRKFFYDNDKYNQEPVTDVKSVLNSLSNINFTYNLKIDNTNYKSYLR
jgi:hypothetical protein